MKKTNKKKPSVTFSRLVIAHGCKVLDLEYQAIQSLKHRIDDKFVIVVKEILSCQGKLVFCGMGKAGIIAQKIAGTFSSLGYPSFYMHAAEAGHGDLGMIDKKDMVFLFSNSGNTHETTSIIPFIKEIGSLTVCITGNRYSYLYKNVDMPLWIGNHEEACGLGLAPTTSTTLMIALGDALAVSVLKQNKNFNEKRFAFNHPRGSLGKKLLRVKNAMRTGVDIVTVNKNTLVKQAIVEMTQTQIGSAVVIDHKYKVKGIFSDGDLRRILEKKSNHLKKKEINKTSKHSIVSVDPLDCQIADVMNPSPQIMLETDYVMDVLKIMSSKKIGEIPVVDKNEKLSGVVCLKDLV